MRIPVSVSFGNSSQTLYMEAVNVPNESGQSYLTGLNAQTTGKFTVLLYDYTSKKTLGESKTVAYGNNISFELTCPSGANTKNQLQLLFYTGEVGKTAYINSTFTNLKIEDITNSEKPPKKIYPMTEDDSGITITSNNNNTIGTIDYQWRRIPVLDSSYGIYPGHKYRITMSKASYEVVDDKVTTYMKFKITDCQGGIKFYDYEIIGSLTATFTIIVKFESGEVKTFITDKVEGIPVYEYKLSADHIYKFADASILKNIDLNINGSDTVKIESKLYNNVSGISIKANLTFIEDSTNLDTLNINSSVEIYDGNHINTKIKSNFNFSTYNPTLTTITNKKWHYIFKYSKGYSSAAYYIIKLTSTSLSGAISEMFPKKNFNFTSSDIQFSIVSNPKIYNKTVISNSLFNLDSKYLSVEDTALGGYSVSDYNSSTDFIIIFGYCGVIGRINDSPIPDIKDWDSGDGFKYIQVSSIKTIDFIPTQLGDGTNPFFKSPPKCIAINGVSSKYKVTLAKDSFSNLKNTTNYYVGKNVVRKTDFGNGVEKETFNGLFESSGSGSTNDYIPVTPFNPGITPKSYEMNMYKPVYNNSNTQNLTADESTSNKYLTVSTEVNPGDKFIIKIDKVSVNAKSTNKKIKKFTTLIYKTNRLDKPSKDGNDVARVDMELGEDLCYHIECPDDIPNNLPIWLLIYAGERGHTQNNSVDFKNIVISKLYTIADYYSYDKIQIGKDSYGREE